MNKRVTVFPFAAIVGLEKAKLALLIAAVNPTVGGVLLRGDKGTGKSTLVRALADVLPDIEVVADCPFNCNPNNALEMCDSCFERLKRGEELPKARRKMKVVDLPLSITVDRLVGTLDIKKALKEGVRALQPGLLAEANRNVLYIDEVNLLDDYVADVLLDSAAMGWNIVEREGVSVKHPARFILVGSMNPEEGELRPQILDRFGLSVDVEAPMDPDLRIEIVKRVEKFNKDPDSFYDEYKDEQMKIKRQVENARSLISKVEISDELLKMVAETVIKMGIRTNRAEIVTVKAAKAIAALEGRLEVTEEDIVKAMELALPHRLRAKPFDQVDREMIKKAISEVRPQHTHSHHDEKRETAKSKSDSNHSQNSQGNAEALFKADLDVQAKMLPQQIRQSLQDIGFNRGSRGTRITVVGYPHGYPISYVPPLKASFNDVDINATLTLASLRSKGEIRIDEEDIRIRVRKARAPRLVVLLLDSSGSMAALRRISIAKGLAWKLIEDSYVKRDLVSLIVFRGLEAKVVVEPTRRYDFLIDALDKTPTGGRTPLASALNTLLMLAKSARMKSKWLTIKGILITDGKANVPLGKGDIEAEILMLAQALKKEGIELEIYATRPPISIDPSPSYIESITKVASAKVFKA
ncbi:MAG: ATP-binding protein [Candidatus Nezhaarchaeales archaeon]